MTDWTFYLATGELIATIVGLFIPFIVLRVFPARKGDAKSTKRTHRVNVPKRYPVKSPTGNAVLTREEAKKILDQERGARALNLFGAVFGLGMLFTLYVISSHPGDVFTCYGYCTVSPNLFGDTSLVLIPLGLELIGAGVYADARRKQRTAAWVEIHGEMLALAGHPPTKRFRVAMTEDEKRWLEELEKEEEEANS